MISILNCATGNHGSVLNMLKKAGYKKEILLTADPTILDASKAIIFPGVGNFENVMKSLLDRNLDKFLQNKFLQNKIFFLGICAGMQVLFNSSEESKLKGLGYINSDLKKFRIINQKYKHYKIPHMGWNKILVNTENLIVKDLLFDNRFYFTHSYYASGVPNENVIAKVRYIEDFPCIVNQGKVFGVQFHPEKSHKFGEKLFKNFLELIK